MCPDLRSLVALHLELGLSPTFISQCKNPSGKAHTYKHFLKSHFSFHVVPVSSLLHLFFCGLYIGSNEERIAFDAQKVVFVIQESQKLRCLFMPFFFNHKSIILIPQPKNPIPNPPKT